jgi:hypothetical protein
MMLGPTLTVLGTTARPQPNAVLVAGAGTAQVNGSYPYTGMAFGKPYYYDAQDMCEIAWDGSMWHIFDAGGFTAYQSTSDVYFPWDAVWTAGTGSLPVPTVTRTRV